MNDAFYRRGHEVVGDSMGGHYSQRFINVELQSSVMRRLEVVGDSM